MQIKKRVLESILKRLDFQSPYERDEVRIPLLPELGIKQKKAGDPRIILELIFRYDFQAGEWVLIL